MSQIEAAFSKYENTAAKATIQQAAVEKTEAAVNMDTAGTCPMCKKTMQSGLVSSRDIPTFWCSTCHVATPAHNSMFASC